MKRLRAIPTYFEDALKGFLPPQLYCKELFASAVAANLLGVALELL